MCYLRERVTGCRQRLVPSGNGEPRNTPVLVPSVFNRCLRYSGSPLVRLKISYHIQLMISTSIFAIMVSFIFFLASVLTSRVFGDTIPPSPRLSGKNVTSDVPEFPNAPSFQDLSVSCNPWEFGRVKQYSCENAWAKIARETKPVAYAERGSTREDVYPLPLRFLSGK